MATQAQRIRRQRARKARAARCKAAIAGQAHVLPVAKAGRRRNRGLLSDIGNMFLPGIGGAIGQVGDNLVGGLLGSGKGRNFAPVAAAGRRSAVQVNTSIERGHERLTVINIPANTPAGTILLQSLVAAPTLGKRLSAFSELWSNTTFLGFGVQVTSSNPTTVSGNYTVAIDPDPVQAYPSSEDLPERLMALTTAASANLWADTYISMRNNPLKLFNKFNIGGSSDAEIRQFAAGQILLATTTASGDTDCTLNVEIDWHVRFERPDTQAPESVVEAILAIPSNTPANVGSATMSDLGVTNIASFLAPMPPDGSVIELPVHLSFETEHVSSGVTYLRIARMLTIVGTAGVFTCDTPFGQSGSFRIKKQNPNPYRFTITQPARISHRKIGYAKIANGLSSSNHRQWQSEHSERTRAKRLESLYLEEEERRFRESLHGLSLEQIRQRGAEDSRATDTDAD